MGTNTANGAPFNRHTGLLVIEVRNSNPNGDPDQESDPRTLETDGRGLISPVSLKRKVRDLVLRDGEVMAEARRRIPLGQNGDGNEYGILEARDRNLKEIGKLGEDEFKKRYWDARLFGNTMLEAMKQAKVDSKGSIEHFISTGVAQMGVGISVAPVHIIRWTQTNVSSVETAKAGEKEKSRGMAPLSFRVVEHAVYTMPFFINPELARKTGATTKDLELFRFMLPKAYPLTASGSRASVFPIHCWLAEHTSPWGSCPDPLILDALTPRLKDSKGEPPTSVGDYVIPDKLDDGLRKRLKSFVDLCAAES